MNAENLKPMNLRTKSEQREIAIKGGKASGKARANKKTFRELFEIALSIEDDSGLTEKEKIVWRAIEKAKETGSIAEIRDTIGEKPTDIVDISKITKIEVEYVDGTTNDNSEQFILGDEVPQEDE